MKQRSAIAFAFALALALAAASASAAPIESNQVEALDGDTIRVHRQGSGKESMRVQAWGLGRLSIIGC